MTLSHPRSSLLGILLLCSLGNVQSDLPHGVHPELVAHYESGGRFTCLDGSERIPYNQINDDYCDCRDGSDEPGTSACSNGMFYCLNQKHPLGGRPLSSTKVNDGVCDCCDGSDENFGGVSCPDICVQEAAREREETLAEQQMRMQGDEIRNGLVQQVASRQKIIRSSLYQEMVFYNQQVKQASSYFEQMKKEAESLKQKKKKMTPQLYRALEQSYQVLAYHHVPRFHFMQKTFEADYGPADVYLSLLDQPCVRSKPINEKELKGGTSNTVPRSYVYVFCPFRNITQHEPGYMDWHYQQALSKVGDTKHKVDKPMSTTGGVTGEKSTPNSSPKAPGTAAVDGGVARAEAVGGGELSTEQVEEIREEMKKAKQPDPTVLGRWMGWDNTSLVTMAVGTTNEKEQLLRLPMRMLYSHGEKCANGEYRAVNVSLECGLENSITSFVEDGVCQYRMSLSTPTVCYFSRQSPSGAGVDKGRTRKMEIAVDGSLQG